MNKGKEEIIEAAKEARIHDKVITFPDGYATKVGYFILKVWFNLISVNVV